MTSRAPDGRHEPAREVVDPPTNSPGTSSTRLLALRGAAATVPVLPRELRPRTAMPDLHVRVRLPRLPAALEPTMNTTLGPPGSPPPSRLLGRYPHSRLHLAGSSAPADPPRPTRWAPPPAPLSYGVDYRFLHHIGQIPLRWPTNSRITLRLRRPSRPRSIDTGREALSVVAGELRELGLDIEIGQLLDHDQPLGQPEPGAIHVAYLDLTDQLPGHIVRNGARGDYAGLGGPLLSRTGTYYAGGFALVFTDMQSPPSPAATTIGVLRHELGHALGLDHPHRQSLAMHHRGPLNREWGPGDELGLRLVGPSSSVARRAVSHPPRQEMP